jgi:hypothetical protein
VIIVMAAAVLLAAGMTASAATPPLCGFTFARVVPGTDDAPSPWWPKCITTDDTVVFSDAYGTRPATRTWIFGDGDVMETTDSEVTHQYSRIGTYAVSLMVCEEDGDCVACCQCIIIRQPDPIPFWARGYGATRADSRGVRFDFAFGLDWGYCSCSLCPPEDSQVALGQVTIIEYLSNGQRIVLKSKCVDAAWAEPPVDNAYPRCAWATGWAEFEQPTIPSFDPLCCKSPLVRFNIKVCDSGRCVTGMGDTIWVQVLDCTGTVWMISGKVRSGNIIVT